MKELESILLHFYQTTSVPVYLYNRNLGISPFSHEQNDFFPPKYVLDKLVPSTREIDYLESGAFSYFGSIKIDRFPFLQIIIGPILQMTVQKNLTENLIEAYELETTQTDDFSLFLESLPIMPLNQFLNLLRAIFFFTNKREISTEDLLKSRDTIFRENQAVIQTYESRENLHYNNSYNVENMLCAFVENGELDEISKFIEQPFQIHEGKIAESNLRQAKNTAIVFITLITRAAIRGGLDTESTFQLSDKFIRQIEQLHTLEPIQHLMQEMLFKLTIQVQNLKLGKTKKEFIPLIRYIKKNVNQPLSVTTLANKFGYSRGYLSESFKKYNGISLHDFIIKCKIEEAKQLLSYTDKPISTVSNYLCFSSQSHFQTVFKKITGESPGKYRKNQVH